MTLSTPYVLAVDVNFRPTDVAVTVLFNNRLLHIPPLAVNFLTNLLLKQMKGMTNRKALTANRISVVNHPFQYTVADRVILSRNFRSTGFFFGLAVAWATVFCFPNMMFCFIQEKAFKHLQLNAGLSLSLFWLTKFLWNFFVWNFLATLGPIFIVLTISELNGFHTFDAILAVLELCLPYGFCIFGFVAVLSFIPIFNQSPLHGFLYSMIIGFFIGKSSSVLCVWSAFGQHLGTDVV
jgi:hypothetical protein